MYKKIIANIIGMEEFYIRDCNGYMLGFASPQETRA